MFTSTKFAAQVLINCKLVYSLLFVNDLCYVFIQAEFKSERLLLLCLNKNLYFLYMLTFPSEEENMIA